MYLADFDYLQKPLPFSSENVKGDINDVIKVARQSLNRSNASRIISKQECMVELANLPLVLCSEDIENINISGAMRLKENGVKDHNNSFLLRYQNRPEQFENLSVCEFFHIENKAKSREKIAIPHFIGMVSTPTYPPTATYARSTLIVHTPWRQARFHLMSDNECISQFETYQQYNKFPKSVILAYNKVRTQFIEKRVHKEPIQTIESDNLNNGEIATEDQQLIRVMTSMSSNITTIVNINGLEYNRGITYDWSKRVNSVSFQTT